MCSAIQDSEDKVWFGPVGITPGERALVNIYAIGNPEMNDETPWKFAVRIFDRRGALVQVRRLELAAGVIGTVELAIQDEADASTAHEQAVEHFERRSWGSTRSPIRRANGR